MMSSRSFAAVLFVAAVGLAGCGGGSDSASDSAPRLEPAGTTTTGVRVVSPAAAAATIAESPDDLVILDVRTAEEFNEAHIEGAVMLDFYREDFAQQLATLDPEVPYVLYCRSGNRSSQARALMEELGFVDVEDVDGGIVGWQEAGLPVVAG